MIIFIGFLLIGIALWIISIYADWYIQRESQKAEDYWREIWDAEMKAFEKSNEVVRNIRKEN